MNKDHLADSGLTDFGFKKVSREKKSDLVKGVFNRVAKRYDLMNDLMSAGLHRCWKAQMVGEVDLLPGREYQILDVAGGTGDIAFRLARKAKGRGVNAQIIVADINNEMLEVGKERAVDHNLFTDLKFEQADSEALPYPDESFDYYTVAFGVRNFTDINKALKEAFRVLKPGGKFICLELSHVENLALAKIYDLYSFKIIPKVGQLITGDKDSYQYLIESIRKFPNQENFKNMIKQAGFVEVKYQNMNFGVVALHSGLKPAL